MLRTIDDCPKPVVAMVQGAAIGGGVGLVAACDIAVAGEAAQFATSEVRLGIVPAVIAPFVVARDRPARGAALVSHRRAVRRRRGAARSGWCTRWCRADQLEARVAAMVAELLKGGPEALASAKQLVRLVEMMPQGGSIRPRPRSGSSPSGVPRPRAGKASGPSWRSASPPGSGARALFDSLLIANRGEIACRDRRDLPAARHPRRWRSIRMPTATRAMCGWPTRPCGWAGAGAPRATCVVDALLEAARRTGAAAVHPGYGFLSESAAFARAVREAGLIFVGPPAEAMERLGGKDSAKALLAPAGVPLVPGYHGADQADAHLRPRPTRIGFPLLIKATAGGGGKGMRKVDGRRISSTCWPPAGARPRRRSATTGCCWSG